MPRANQDARGELLLVAALLGSAALYALTFRLQPLAPLGPLRNLLATLGATLPFALVALLAERTAELRRAHWALMLGGLLLLRLSIPLPLLEGSDDAYRYLWDGRVLAAGINPYAQAPAHEALAPLRDATFHPRIFRPEMRTVYPPLAQLWFFGAHAISSTSFVGLKLVLLLHDAVSASLLVLLLRRAGQPPLRALLFAWSPLVVVQLFAGAHLDGLLVPWLLAALLLAARRPALAGAALGAATMVRPVAALCLPTLVLRRPWREGARGAGAFVGVVAALLLPFAGAGHGLFESLLVYGTRWRFNGSLFRAIEALAGYHRARAQSYALIVAGSLGAAWLPAPRSARFLVAYALYFALAATVYPWYLVPLVALGARFGGPLVVLLPALVTLSDLVHAQPTTAGWTVPTVALVTEYGVICALGAWELWRRRRAGAAIARRA